MEEENMYIETKGLKKSYGEGGSFVQVLKGVDIGIKAGEMCVIQGTSGSGKSTLLNCLGGLDSIDTGSVTVAGTSVEKLKGEKLDDYRRKNLGFIFLRILILVKAFDNLSRRKAFYFTSLTNLSILISNCSIWTHICIRIVIRNPYD